MPSIFAAQSAGAELRVIGVCDGCDFQPTLPSSHIFSVFVNMDWGMDLSITYSSAGFQCLVDKT